MRLGQILRRGVMILAVAVMATGGCVDKAAHLADADESPAVKNVILMIADGCGYYHVDAASLYRHGKTGATVVEAFPVVLAVSTYPAGGSYEASLAWADFEYVKKGATDSAAAATAMATGQKTYNGAIGVVGEQEKPVRVENVLEHAETLGKATGVVSSVQFSHATPAGFVAHNASRNNYAEIAREMIFESATDVIMGCGNPLFGGSGQALEEPEEFKFVGGEEAWAKIVAGPVGADADGDGTADPWTVVHLREDFVALASGDAPSRVLGIPNSGSTLQSGRGGDEKAVPYEVPQVATFPTLAEMTRGALNVLDDDPDGLFLMIEGGAVDWTAHDNNSGRMIEEELEFLDAVSAVVEWVEENSNWDETVLIVTGDHETGYPTGPGSGPRGEGEAPVWNPLVSNGAGNLPGIQWNSGSHTRSLLPLYARGSAAKELAGFTRGSDPVRGPYIDNTDIALFVFQAMR